MLEPVFVTCTGNYGGRISERNMTASKYIKVRNEGLNISLQAFSERVTGRPVGKARIPRMKPDGNRSEDFHKWFEESREAVEGDEGGEEERLRKYLEDGRYKLTIKIEQAFDEHTECQILPATSWIARTHATEMWEVYQLNVGIRGGVKQLQERTKNRRHTKKRPSVNSRR